MDPENDISLSYNSAISAGPNGEITEIPNKVNESLTERFNEEMDLEDKYVFVKDDSETMDEVMDYISVTEESEIVPKPSTGGVSEKMDLQGTHRPAENFRGAANNSVIMTEESNYTPELSTEEIDEAMDFEGNLIINEDGTAEDREIIDGTAENISAIENVVTIIGSHTESACEIMDLGAEPVPSSEISEKIYKQPAENTNIDENSVTIPATNIGRKTEIMDSKATFLLSTKRDYQAENKAAENIKVTESVIAVSRKSTDDNMKKTDDSVNENMELGTTSLFSSKEFVDMLDQANTSESETYKAYAVLNTEMAGKSTMPNERNVNFVLRKVENNIENETGNENLETLESETKKLNVVLSLKRGKRKRKAPPTSKMVMDSIKSLKGSNGASFEDIKKHMEEKYPVNVKALLKYHVNNFLKKCVDIEVLEKIGGTDGEERFKIKKWNE